MISLFIVISIFGLLDKRSGFILGVTEGNLDSKVDTFISKWLPFKHKPHLTDNTVYVMADLYNIVDLDEVSETITTKLWLYIAYIIQVPIEDWDEIDTDIYSIEPGLGKVWKPDIIILNKVETKAISGANPLVMKHWCCDETNVTDCDYCGALVVFPESRTEITTCSIDVVDFPFDYQNCVISIGPWMNDLSSMERYLNDDGQEVGAYRVEVVNYGTSMSLVSYEENSQWQLLGAPVVSKTRVAQHDSKKEFEVLEYTLKLKRKPQFFIYTLILPCFFLTSLTVLSVLVPVESGEKMGLGVTVLLAQVVNLLILSSFLPASSQYFPQLGYYVLLTIVLISLCLVYNAIVINVYYHGYWNVVNFIRRKVKVNPEAAQNSQNNSPNNNERMSIPGDDLSSKQTELEECSEEEVKTRQKRCIVADHIFAVLIFIANAILHFSFFCPYM